MNHSDFAKADNVQWQNVRQAQVDVATNDPRGAHLTIQVQPGIVTR